MKILHVEADASIKSITRIVGGLRGIEFDGRYLPEEIYPTAETSFATEEELVGLLQAYQGAVLDWTTFGHERIRGGSGSALPQYLGAIQQSGYARRVIVVTTDIGTSVADKVREIHPPAEVFVKPYNLSDLLVTLGGKPLSCLGSLESKSL